MTSNPRIVEYAPKALYYEDADALEYVRTDAPHVYRRIDEFLTLILDIDTREPIGFKIKGFRNIYLKNIKPQLPDHSGFPRLITLLEKLMTTLGDGVFLQSPRHEAYTAAANIAVRDQVIVIDLPTAA